MRDVAEQVAGGRLRISVAEDVRIHILRLWRPEAAVLTALGKALGAPLPVRPNTVSGDEPHMLWMGPGEFCLIGAGPEIEAKVAKACKGALYHLADVGDGRAVLTIEGAEASELLSKGCSLDFHPRGFPTGTCAQSPLAQTRALIERSADGRSFNVIIDRTFLAHLQGWLQVATLDFVDAGA